MSCHDPCSHEQEILNRLATLEEELDHYVQTVNGIYGPFVTIDIPDLGPIEERVVILEDGQIAIIEKIAGLSFVESITGFTTSPTLVKMLFEMRDGVSVEKSFPVVSEVNQGAMTPTAYKQIFIDKQRIDQIISGTVIVTFDFETNTPTQLAITTEWISVMERDPRDGDRVLNLFNNVLMVFASDNWYTQSASATPQATNSTLGTMMGSLEAGQCQVEMDGTLSVNDWDPTLERIGDLEAGKLNKVASTSGQLMRVYTVNSAGEQIMVFAGFDYNWVANTIVTRAGAGIIRVATTPIGSNDATSKSYVDEKDNLRILKQQPIADAGKILTVGTDGLVFNSPSTPVPPLQLRVGSSNLTTLLSSVTNSSTSTPVVLLDEMRKYTATTNDGSSMYYENKIIKYPTTVSVSLKGTTQNLYEITNQVAIDREIQTFYYPDMVTQCSVKFRVGCLMQGGSYIEDIVGPTGNKIEFELSGESCYIDIDGKLNLPIPSGLILGCFSREISTAHYITYIEVSW